MCIIIAKDKKSRLPKEEELRNSFIYNSDGAGFMYVDNGKVVIDKGYMNWEDFIKRYYVLLAKYNDFKNKSLVIHCRIGTSGKNIKDNTHPYPITNSTRLLKTTKLSNCDIGIVHNGIIRDYGTTDGLNDTQEYISTFLYPIYESKKDFYKDKGLVRGIKTMTNSKFAILDKEDKIHYIGDFIDDDGLKFSNNSYISYSSRYYSEGNDWYYKKYLESKKEEEGELNEDYLYPLEENWYIDLFGNGYPELVGKKEYYFDWLNLGLYEYKDGDFHLIAEAPIIYDENYEEIW